MRLQMRSQQLRSSVVARASDVEPVQLVATSLARPADY
eukprot:COSAG05_NODE_841_length_7021_cov_5.980352_3_plen_38_part_00